MSYWGVAAKTAAAVVVLLGAAHAGAVQDNFGYFEGVNTLEFTEDYSGDPECRPASGTMMSLMMHGLSFFPIGPKILTGPKPDGDAVLSAQETMLYIPEARACTGSIAISITRRGQAKFDGSKAAKAGPIGIYNDTHVILQTLPAYAPTLSQTTDLMAKKLRDTWAVDNPSQHQ